MRLRPAHLASVGRFLVHTGAKLAPLFARLKPSRESEAPTRRFRARQLVPVAVGALAGLASLVGTVRAIESDSGWDVPVGLVLHTIGVFLCLLAARMRRRGDISDAETDIVLTAAAFVPGFGPAIAWSLPRESATEAVENAHEVIERYHDHVKPVVPDYERSLFTGDPDRDLARKLDA
ncbi:MAG: hypothetical protein ABFS86_12800, partial [Planctomycetota bacterium]